VFDKEWTDRIVTCILSHTSCCWGAFTQWHQHITMLGRHCL